MTINMVFPATLNDTQNLYRPFHEQAKHKQSLGFAWVLFKRQALNKAVVTRTTHFMSSMNCWSFRNATMTTPLTIQVVFPATLDDTQDLYRLFHEQAKHKHP